MNCKWTTKPFFSSKINKLFNSIFTEANKRIFLEDLPNCDFLKSHTFDCGDYIDFKKELVVPEDIILALA